MCVCPVCPANQYCDSAVDPPSCRDSVCTLPTSWGPQVQKVVVLKLLSLETGCDLDGDGKPNNVLGKLTKLYPEVNSATAQRIADGELVWLFESEDWQGDASAVSLSLLRGERHASNSSCDPVSQSANCPYTVSAASYAMSGTPGECDAKAVFPNAALSAGQLTTGSEAPPLVELALPLFDFDLALAISKASLKAQVSVNGEGTTLKNGQICGAVSRQVLQSALLALTEDTLAQIGGNVGVLQMLVGLLAPDLDLNDDGAKESISFALGFETVPGQIVGLTAAP